MLHRVGHFWENTLSYGMTVEISFPNVITEQLGSAFLIPKAFESYRNEKEDSEYTERRMSTVSGRIFLCTKPAE